MLFVTHTPKTQNGQCQFTKSIVLKKKQSQQNNNNKCLKIRFKTRNEERNRIEFEIRQIIKIKKLGASPNLSTNLLCFLAFFVTASMRFVANCMLVNSIQRGKNRICDAKF